MVEHTIILFNKRVNVRESFQKRMLHSFREKNKVLNGCVKNRVIQI